jgi:hypothetical protein
MGHAMNREWVLVHLSEAADDLNRMVREVEATQDYDDGAFLVAMMHIYHHLNTAWNSRNATPEDAAAGRESDFRHWRQFPPDVPLD